MLKFPEGKITFPTQKILLARKYCPVLVYTFPLLLCVR